MSKIPSQIQEFAEKYFAAEARADICNSGKVFRAIDKKMIARECKFLLASGASENIRQLSQDLSNYKRGLLPSGHITRLYAFARYAGVVYGPSKHPHQPAAPAQVVRRAPSPAFDIRADLTASFSTALGNGMSLKALQSHARAALLDSNRQIQVSKVTAGLQDLMRNTGMNASQIAAIATSL